jgi:thioredoxin reductase (NADPH)
MLKNVKSGAVSQLATDGVFIFIGHSPNTSLYAGQLDMNDKGFLVIDDQMQTSIPGVFAAGEIADMNYKQVITSAGMGAAAAIQATRYLENK